MIIYVITKGDYSDYSICAVTDNKEKAELLKEYYTDIFFDARIEQYDTENPKTIEIRPAFNIWFDEKGNVSKVYKYNELRKNEEEYIDESFTNPNEIYAVVFADSEQKAIKIAAERRAKYLAERMQL